MGSGRAGGTLAKVCLAFALGGEALASGGAAWQVSAPAIQTTLVSDKVYKADGTAAAGTVLIRWPAFTTAAGANVPAGSTAAAIGAGGVLSVALVPNANATPIGSYYTVVYHLDDGSVTREYWVVPASVGSVKLAGIRSTVLPTSVAMQTVSKSYVDTAIAAALTGHPLDSTPYVLKSGDSMMGSLLLAADPQAPMEASDKHYVDATVAAVSAGIAQKVSTVPGSMQTVSQPSGTTLAVNSLNGVKYASQYQTGVGGNGIANAAGSADCSAGCDVVAEQSYVPVTGMVEATNPDAWNDQTHVEDLRGGARKDSFLNPSNVESPGINYGATIRVDSTAKTQAIHAATGAGNIFSGGLEIDSNALAGGSNVFPALVQGTVPYFKTTYTALSLKGKNNTLGQHVLTGQEQNCFGVGDCLMGGLYMRSSGGFRDDADEGAHPFDLQFSEDQQVFGGTCASGCSTGSKTLAVSVTSGSGTQGEGRYLIDTNPAKVITAGSISGGTPTGVRQPVANFLGTNFAVSTLLETAQTVPTQADNIEPGTVTVPIVTSGVPAGFASDTSALPSMSGVACLADVAVGGGRPTNWEMAAYTVVDGTHLRLTLVRPHATGATVAVGGLCGYGLEQKVDTVGGLKQVFPVVGSTSATSLIYAGSQTQVVGVQQSQSAYANLSLVATGFARSNNVVTISVAGGMPVDLNGLTLTVQGVSDPSYNGSFQMSAPTKYTLTYAQSGPDSTSTGGVVSIVTGSYALYPMAEVLNVFNASTRAVDGQLTLSANTVKWEPGDSVEEPHYFQQAVSADMEFITQYLPRPARPQSAGIDYIGTVGPGLKGWLIENLADPGQYYGNGGTHTAPSIGMQVNGVWGRSLELEAGEEAAVKVHCNSHGCDRWDSTYDLFQMDTSVGVDEMRYQPQTSTLTLNLRGTPYVFDPLGLTAGTINAQTVNATALHGTFSGTVTPGSVPVFGASGAAHQPGAVPDPGATQGTVRFLREDGTWAAVSGSSGGSATTPPVLSSTGPNNLPGRSDLLGEYLLNEGAGQSVHDSSGLGNHAVLGGVNGGPQWEGTTDLNFGSTGEYVQLPGAVNAARTWQIAFYNPPFGSATQPQAPGYGDQSAFGANPSILCGTDASHLCLTAGSAGKSMLFLASTDGTKSADPMPVGWHVFTMICGAGSGSPTRYLYDGSEVGSYASAGNGTTCPTPTGGNYQIGGSSQGTGTWFVGKVAAAWAWNRPLTLSEGAAAAKSGMDYIRMKGVPAGYRAVESDAPLVLAGLDERSSPTAGAPATAWPAAMTLSDGSYTVASVGLNQTVYDACVQFDLTLGQRIASGRGPVIVVLWGGVNDLLDGRQTPRQVANSLRCLVKKSRQAGARVIVSTEISSSNGGAVDGDAGKNALNAILRTEAMQWGADNLVDLATETHMGPDGAYSNTGCFSDGRHLTQYCEPYVATLMQNAINELLGSTETSRHQTTSANYQEQAGDLFLDLMGSTQQTVALPDCTGLSLQRQVVNSGSSSAVVLTQNQPLTGSTTVNPGLRALYAPVPGGSVHAGCSWTRLQ